MRPTTHIGKDGITDAVARAVENALNTRDVLKVKVLDTAAIDARDAAAQLAERIDNTEVVQVMGRVITLYRDGGRVDLPKK